jgi:quercetin dioxygenase-like cupin family protein
MLEKMHECVRNHAIRSSASLLFATACAATPLPVAAPPSATSAAASQANAGVSRTLLDQSDLPGLPGWETRLFLVEYAPGVAAPTHHHPVGGVGYVLSGSFESAFEGQSPSVVHEGESFRELPDVPHVLFKNVEPAKPLRFVIAFVVRKGEPVLVVP